MTRLALATLLCALGTTQPSAQNVVTQGLLDLDDDERNASFTLSAGRTSEGVTLNAAYRRPIGANVRQTHLALQAKHFICAPGPQLLTRS